MSAALRSAIRRISRSGAFAQLVSLLERTGDGPPSLLRVLTYHRIGEPAARADLYPNIVSAAPEQFARQMEFLAAGFHVISMPDLLARLDADQPLPPRCVLITFDDAYTDFAEIAWPVMKRLGLTATLFVPTSFPDNPACSFWWDRVHQAVHGARCDTTIDTSIGPLAAGTPSERTATVKRLTQHVKTLPHNEAMHFVDDLCTSLGIRNSGNEVLGWDELRRLAREGVTLGAHTRTHPLMNRMPLSEARDEAVGSLADIEREVGGQPPVLAYPAGGCTYEVARMLEREGFRLAFTTERGLNDMRSADRLLLCRINVACGTSDALLRAQMLPVMKHASRWLP